jgi:hypothetical protein
MTHSKSNLAPRLSHTLAIGVNITVDLISYFSIFVMRAMLFNETIDDTRQFFFATWHKYRQKQSLSPLETQLVNVLLLHPEYHALLDSPALEKDVAYFPELGEINPFLHLGLHLALRDQIMLDRPHGIAEVYQLLLKRHADVTFVEHLMMEPLAECLWQAQRNHAQPNDAYYLAACQALLR